MAIKAKDLRVGNLLYFPFHKEVVEVVGLPLLPDGKQGVQVKTQGTILCEELLEQFNPIPLTEEEWLGEKLKFIRDKSRVQWIKDGIRICLTPENRFVYPDAAHDYVYIDFVHELQNLFKQLTKNELTIK